MPPARIPTVNQLPLPIVEELAVCPSCDGIGLLGFPNPLVERVCPDCRGEGMVSVESIPCADCGIGVWSTHSNSGLLRHGVFFAVSHGGEAAHTSQLGDSSHAG